MLSHPHLKGLPGCLGTLWDSPTLYVKFSLGSVKSWREL